MSNNKDYIKIADVIVATTTIINFKYEMANINLNKIIKACKTILKYKSQQARENEALINKIKRIKNMD